LKWWWSLLIIPTFLFAGLSRKGYDQLVEQSAEQERRAYKCIIELNFTCDLEKDAEKMLRLIDESILCWRKAKENYEIILKEIAASSFFRRYFSYRLFLKLNCNERKSNAIEQLKGLEEPRKAIVSKVNADKALLLYQQGMKKVNLAVERENSWLAPHLQGGRKVWVRTTPTLQLPPLFLDYYTEGILDKVPLPLFF